MKSLWLKNDWKFEAPFKVALTPTVQNLFQFLFWTILGLIGKKCGKTQHLGHKLTDKGHKLK